MNIVERGHQLDLAVDEWFRSCTGWARVAVLAVIAAVAIAFAVLLAVYGGWGGAGVSVGGVVGTCIGLEVRRRRACAVEARTTVDVRER